MSTLEDGREASSHKSDSSAPQASKGRSVGDVALKPQAEPPAQSVSRRDRSIASGGEGLARDKAALLALAIACVAVFLTALDQTVVVTALPQIINDLQVPITQIDHASWIISAYLLGFIVTTPLMGHVSDIYGRRHVFLLCLLIFGIGSVLCGLAPLLGRIQDLGFLAGLGIDTSSPGLLWLIAARLVQAIGGGAIVPVAMAIAGDFYGQERLGLALGMIGAVTEAGGVLGPLYGAVVVQHLGWQYIFYFNVPLVIGLLIAAWKAIPPGTRLREGIDWPGAILLALALTCLSLGLAQQGMSLSLVTGSDQHSNPFALVLAAIFLLAFLLVEWKVRWPVVELSLFKRLPFNATALVSLLVGAALIIAMADIPIFVNTVLQLPVLDSGLALLRLTVMIPVGALLGGWLCHRITCRFTAVLGLLCTAAGFFLMSRWPVHVGWNEITISTMLAGLGFGLVIAPIGTTAINTVKATRAGSSSAVITALRMVGMMLGLAALTSWALAYFRQLASMYPPLSLMLSADQLVQWQEGYAFHLIQSAHTVYSAVFFTSMVLCLLAIIPALFLWGRLRVESGKEEGKRWPRRPFMALGCACLLLLLVGAAFSASFWSQADIFFESPADTTGYTGIISGPRLIDLALDKYVLTSVFVARLNVSPDVLSELTVTPAPDDGLVLAMNVHLRVGGLRRVMPVELDCTVSIDAQQNLKLTILHFKRDGLDAGPAAAAQMQVAVNQMLASAVMPALRGNLKGVKLISAHTSSTVVCGRGIEMLVLRIQSPPIKGIASQAAPLPFCLNGPLNKTQLSLHQRGVHQEVL